MPYSVDEKHSPSGFYYPGETNYPKAKITLNKTATKTAKKKCFLVFSTKSEKIAIQQSHIINPLLTSFARSVRESIAFGFYRTDLAPSSLGLYENLRQYFPVQTSHSVNKSVLNTAVQLMIFFKTNKMAERLNLNTNEIDLEETKLLLKIRTKHQIMDKSLAGVEYDVYIENYR